MGKAQLIVLALAMFRTAPPCLLVASQTDADAFADFYAAYSRRVLVFFVRRVLDAEVALDLMSETFASALENRRQFRGTTAEQEQAWLFAIARNELKLYWYKGSVERRALARVGVEPPALSDSELERIEDAAELASLGRHLSAAMADLPEEQRQAVKLRVVDELGYAEVARLLDVTQQAARARVSRGLRRMSATMQGAALAEEVA